MLKTKVCSKCEYLIFNFLISYFCFRHTFIFSFGDEDMFSLKCCIPIAKNIRDSMDRFIKTKEGSK